MTRLQVRYLYWTDSIGTGGKLKTPEDFIVRENIDRKFFSRFSRSRKVEKSKGKYSLYKLSKRNMTTESALEKISQKFSLPLNSITYAGLKDKFAVTEQYITVNSKLLKNIKGNPRLDFICLTEKKLSVGDLLSNSFEITLHGCKTGKNTIENSLKEIKKGIPNYFGLQRFGVHKNNHIIGKLILERDFKKALKMINKCYKRNYKNIGNVGKPRLKFFINAYQSWVFNNSLNLLVNKKKYYKGFLPIIGYNTKGFKKFSGKTVRPKCFYLPELQIKVIGSVRKAFIKPKITCYSAGKSTLRIMFDLPKGSYATMLLRELAKKEVR